VSNIKRLIGTLVLPALVLATVVAVPRDARALSGGPDGGGYTWKDNAEPGIVYSWEEISGTGTDLLAIAGVVEDDHNFGFQPMSFPFPYYGGAYTQVAPCSNGWVSVVDDVSNTLGNVALPTFGSSVGTIAAFWDDIEGTPAVAGGVGHLWYQDFGTHVTVEWDHFHDYDDDTQLFTFEAMLYPDGRIVVQYLDMVGSTADSTCGIESPSEVDGLTVFDGLVGGAPRSAYRVEFMPPAPIPNSLDCPAAIPITCSSRITGDTRTGAANQDTYRCTAGDYSGRELIYRLDLAATTSLRAFLTATSGNPEMLVVRQCDPNLCVAPPSRYANLVNLPAGTYDIIIDEAPGSEGSFELVVACDPVANQLDCASPQYITCGDRIHGNLATGQARQDAYGCGTTAYGGRELVYEVDLPQPINLTVTLTEDSGNPDALLIGACDPNNCQLLDNGSVTLTGANGTYFIVVDAPTGQEGEFDLAIDCYADDLAFCATGVLQTNPWGDANGAWLVDGWLYPTFDTGNFSMRIDGGTIYEHEAFGTCANQFPTVQYGVIGLTGPAFVEWGAPEGTIREDLAETSSGGCCGLLVNITVTNTDSVPHFYEFRTYHDTTFGYADGTGACTATVDGGPIEVNGTRYLNEIDLLAVGGDTCQGQVEMFSADHPTDLHSSFQMLPPNLPTTMEWIAWNEGGSPCTQWKSFVDGEAQDGCNGGGFGDSSLLFIWRFPQTAGTLAPGESARASYRIGYQCAFPCNIACEQPAMSTASAVDVGPCNDGIRVSWAPAFFPGAGNGVYHVYRSIVSAADALTRPPITSPGGISQTTFTDDRTSVGTSYYYVVTAESLDFPGCGTGPVVGGSTASAIAMPQPVTDSGDVIPPTSDVGPTLRAAGHNSPDSVNFLWPGAPPVAPGESFAILRSDNDPQGPFTRQAVVPAPMWTDPAAPPTWFPAHVWFYDVRVVDSCGNVSND
jgi:hypothetical protein